MHYVAQDDKCKGILQRRAGENEKKSDTDDHTGNGVCHQGNALDDTFPLSSQLASGCGKGCAVGGDKSRKGCQHCHEQGIFIYPQ